jgi:hypothetical protein
MVSSFGTSHQDVDSSIGLLLMESHLIWNHAVSETFDGIILDEVQGKVKMVKINTV